MFDPKYIEDRGFLCGDTTNAYLLSSYEGKIIILVHSYLQGNKRWRYFAFSRIRNLTQVTGNGDLVLKNIVLQQINPKDILEDTSKKKRYCIDDVYYFKRIRKFYLHGNSTVITYIYIYIYIYI